MMTCSQLTVHSSTVTRLQIVGLPFRLYVSPMLFVPGPECNKIFSPVGLYTELRHNWVITDMICVARKQQLRKRPLVPGMYWCCQCSRAKKGPRGVRSRLAA